MKYHRLSVSTIADEIGIDKMTMHSVITENFMIQNICAKFVPKILTDD